jgi:nucleoid-associated protein YgaU
MARETKFGLLFVVVLTSVFGLLVYKRIHTPAGLVAETEQTAEPGGEPAEPEAPELEVPPGAEPGTTADPVSVTELSTPLLAQGAPERPQGAKPKLPVEVADSEFFEPPRPATSENPSSTTTEHADEIGFEPPQRVVATPVELPANEGADADPFGFSEPQVETVETPATEPNANAGALSAPPDGADPFADPQPVAGSPATIDDPAATTFEAVEEPAMTAAGDDPFAAEMPEMPEETEVAAQPVEAEGLESPTAQPVEADPFGAMEVDVPSTKPAPTASALPVDLDGPDVATVAEPLPTIEPVKPQNPPKPAVTEPKIRAEVLPVEIPAIEEPAFEEALAVPQRTASTAAPRVPVRAVPTSDPIEAEPLEPAMPAAKPVASLPVLPEEELPRVAAARPLPTDLDVAPTPRPVAPPAMNNGAYVVQATDSFWTISKRVYGTGRYFQALAKHNVALIPNPERMKLGVRIATPPAAELERRYPAEIPLAAQDSPGATEPGVDPGFFVDAAGQPKYRVGSTDTLSGIARNHLGRASRWVQVFEMNRDVLKDGNSLKVGTVLKLPADASQVQVVGFQGPDR